MIVYPSGRIMQSAKINWSVVFALSAMHNDLGGNGWSGVEHIHDFTFGKAKFKRVSQMAAVDKIDEPIRVD